MEKPRAYIHWTKTSRHDDAGVFKIGRFVLPVSALMTIWGIIVVLFIIWGFIGSSFVNFEDGWSFIPALYAFASVGVLWIIVGIANMFQWLINTIKTANERERSSSYNSGRNY